MDLALLLGTVVKIAAVIFTQKNIQLKRKKKKVIRQAHKKNEYMNVEEQG